MMTEYYFEAQVEGEDGEWYRIDAGHDLLGDAIRVVEKWTGHPSARNHLRVQQVIPTIGVMRHYTLVEM